MVLNSKPAWRQALAFFCEVGEIQVQLYVQYDGLNISLAFFAVLIHGKTSLRGDLCTSDTFILRLTAKAANLRNLALSCLPEKSVWYSDNGVTPPPVGDRCTGHKIFVCLEGLSSQVHKPASLHLRPRLLSPAALLPPWLHIHLCSPLLRG